MNANMIIVYMYMSAWRYRFLLARVI